jgi:N-carbamoyl-L-amino-acid hydrolase
MLAPCWPEKRDMSEVNNINPDRALAQALFDALHEQSFDGVGINRDSYGDGEQRAHDLLREHALRLGLEVQTDAALNLYMTLPGRSRALPRVMTGSHLDSVPRGGNFDGAAGVVAGIAILSGWQKIGYQPLRDVTVMAIRAEESAWFPFSYIGSKAAFGKLPASALQVKRADSGKTLTEHLAQQGGEPQRLIDGEAWLKPEDIDCFIELHIEQGPVLVGAATSLGIVTGICGSLRYRHARTLGRYAHSGATPRNHRQDSVVATSELVVTLQRLWQELEDKGHHLTVTVGQFYTDPQQADFSTVAGQVDFSLDMRSQSPLTLALMDQKLRTALTDITARHGVEIILGQHTSSDPGVVSPALFDQLTTAAAALGHWAMPLPSGAGHDTALFAGAGVDAAMLFVRNANGSHNPDEAMDMEDFTAAMQVLSQVLTERASAG